MIHRGGTKMPVSSEKEDLRVFKVEKALNTALLTLLNHKSFNKLTINGLCSEALVSRATFYAHYADKYDMLKCWLTKYQPHKITETNTYEQIEETANQFVRENKKLIKNLFDGADNETLEILCDYILSVLDIAEKEGVDGELHINYVVLSNFYSGGMVYYLMWQIKNKFPSDVPVMNIHLYKVIEKLRELETA